MENMEQYIGRTIKGFKFEDTKECYYSKKMDNYIGEIGVITAHYHNRFRVEFADDYWLYPDTLALNHIIPTDAKFLTKEEATALIESMTGDKYEII